MEPLSSSSLGYLTLIFIRDSCCNHAFLAYCDEVLGADRSMLLQLCATCIAGPQAAHFTSWIAHRWSTMQALTGFLVVFLAVWCASRFCIKRSCSLGAIEAKSSVLETSAGNDASLRSALVYLLDAEARKRLAFAVA